MRNRRDWLLIYLDLPEGPFGVDQIRAMKGMFLWSQEGPASARNLFRFEPYDFGPFDTGIYHDLDHLEEKGWIRSEAVTGTRRKLFRLTAEGRREAARVMGNVSEADIARLASIKSKVTSMGFVPLLKYVYGKYPEYAVRSVAKV